MQKGIYDEGGYTMSDTYGYTVQGFKKEVYTQEQIDDMLKNQPEILYGEAEPDNTVGKVGDLYIRLIEEE